jgi:hypothetical protein
LVTALESHQIVFEGDEVDEVAWREELALNDREVDFDLVEPTGMDRRVDQDDVWPFGSQSSGSSLAAVGGAVVCDKEHATGGTIRFLAHDLSDQVLESDDAILALTAAEQFGAMHVQAAR